MSFLILLASFSAAHAAEDLTWSGIDLGMVRLVGDHAAMGVPAKRKTPAIPPAPWPDGFASEAAVEWNTRIATWASDMLDSKYRTSHRS